MTVTPDTVSGVGTVPDGGTRVMLREQGRVWDLTAWKDTGADDRSG